MPIAKIRDLGKLGILTDPDPYDLPVEAFSGGVNVRFRNGKISSAPVFRTVLSPLSLTNPRFMFVAGLGQSTNDLFIGYQSGQVKLYANGAETDYTLVGYTPSAVEAVWTSTNLGQVVYCNRSDRVPWYLLPAGTAFHALTDSGTAPNAWDATWFCRILRQCAGALVALNVTKGATVYPTLVKTSSIVSNGAVPTSWDQTTPSTLATENILSAMDGPITDGCSLGTDLIIYGQREAWRMHADGSIFVYGYTKLPFKKGVLNANCSVEIDGKNYCFGLDDIWVHDGISEKSICDQQVRDFIFASANIAQATKFFVQYNPRLNEIYFCYVSGDQYVNFISGVTGCNRSAVYNLTTSTWTFDDLPSVFCGANAPLSNILTYTTVTTTYSTMGGAYQDQEDGGKRMAAFAGDNSGSYGLTTSLYAFDVYGPGSVAPFAVAPAATAPVYLERTGIDLTQIDNNLRDYKNVNSIYPQARIDTSGGSSLQISVGVADYINAGVPTWSAYQPYDGQTNYKLDFNGAGRWIAIRVKWADYRNFTLTGFDLDIKTTGRR